MSAAESCSQCGTILGADVPMGICPKCLLRQGFEGLETVGVAGAPGSSFIERQEQRLTGADGRPIRFGEYELLEKIARGGMGIVFKALQTTVGRLVALKMIITGQFASHAEVLRFRAEAQAAANLDHPNIVPIYEVDEQDGHEYFTMKYIDNGNLTKHIPRLKGNWRAIARTLAVAARAVHHGHRRGILHRDLKPANILIDAENQPHVTDFGVAKNVLQESELTQSGAVVGTPAYMPPEQAAGKTREITVAVDVYSLGAILYEMLTGRPPFVGASAAATLRMVLEDPPTPPSEIVPNVNRDLETICLKCLEKDRGNRYTSALELAEELERFCRGEPIRARPIGRTARLGRLCQRQPVAAALVASAATFLILIALGAILVARQQEQYRRREVLMTNLFSARGAAAMVHSQLDAFGKAVQRAAGNELPQLLIHNNPAALEQYCRQQAQYAADPQSGLAGPDGRSPFDSWFIQTTDGRAIARWPAPPADYLGKRYDWRDYFAGAQRLAQAGLHGYYISRAFESEADGLYKFAISAPVYDTQGKPLAILVASVGTDSTIGPLQLADPRRMAVLVARRDIDRGKIKRPTADPGAGPNTRRASPATARSQISATRPAGEYLILLHEACRHGEAIEIAHPRFSRLTRATAYTARDDDIDENYADPVGRKDPRFAGRYLAGFAAVPDTDFIVIVQTRDADATQGEKALPAKLAGWALLSATPGLAFIGAALWYVQRRRRMMEAAGG